MRKSMIETSDIAMRGSTTARCRAVLTDQADALRTEVLKWQIDPPHGYAAQTIPAALKDAVERLLGVAIDAALKADTALRLLAEHAPRDEVPKAVDLRAANESLVLAAMQAQTKMSDLERSSQRDALTDMPNRALMLDRLKQAIAMAQRHAKRVAVFFVDLDDFKSINDVYGHAVGDAVLQRAARHLESAVRTSDTVSRHGGDEFLVLVTEIALRSDVTAIAAKILSALTKPAVEGTEMLPLSASIGISFYPEDGTDAVTLIERADAAMYRAKRNGRNRFECYVEQLDLVTVR